MSANIRIKRSSVPGKIPTIEQLNFGELAINTYDGRVYSKKDDGEESIFQVGSDDISSEISFSEISSDDSTISLIIDDSFTGDGAETQFTLSSTPLSELYCFITINGVSQQLPDYSLSSNNIIFNEPPEDGDVIEIRTFDLPDTSINSDSYIGNGTNNEFTLSSTPLSELYCFITINGVSQQLPDYNINDNILSFGDIPEDGDVIEIRIFDLSIIDSSMNADSFIGDGANNEFTLSTSSIEESSCFITINGVSQQLPDYNINDNILSFGDIPEDGDVIEVRKFNLLEDVLVLDSFNKNEISTAKYIITMTKDDSIHSMEILLNQNGTNVYMTEYATLFNNTILGEINADVNDDLIRLIFVPNESNVLAKAKRIDIEI